MTVREPFDVKDEVAMMLPPVKVLIVAVTAERMLEKKEVEVAFTDVKEVAVS